MKQHRRCFGGISLPSQQCVLFHTVPTCQEDQPFGLRLILGQLLRDRRIARDVGIAAVSLSLLALAPILFWRMLIDRVLYYGAFDTLIVLCVTMAVLIAFENGFFYLRRFLVLHVTQRV